MVPRCCRIEPSGRGDRHVEPRVVRAVAGREQDGADALGAQVQPAGRAGRPERLRTVRRPDLGPEPGRVDVGVDRVEEPVHAGFGLCDGVAQVRRQGGDTPGQLVQPAGDPDAAPGQGGEADVPCAPLAGVVTALLTAGAADELERRLAACGVRVGHLVDRAGQAPGLLEPPEDVHPPVATWQAGVPARREHDTSPGSGQLVGDLHARGRGTDDEDAAVGQCGRVAVAATPSSGAGPYRSRRRCSARAADPTGRWPRRRAGPSRCPGR